MIGDWSCDNYMIGHVTTMIGHVTTMIDHVTTIYLAATICKLCKKI